jgi:hypothetical protein
VNSKFVELQKNPIIRTGCANHAICLRIIRKRESNKNYIINQNDYRVIINNRLNGEIK